MLIYSKYPPVRVLASEHHFIIDGKIITIPKNFTYDGASIPKFTQWFFGHPFDKHHDEAGLIHDFLYDKLSNKYGYSRSHADKVYRKILLKSEYPKHKAWMEYIVVRIVGRLYYKKKNSWDGL